MARPKNTTKKATTPAAAPIRASHRETTKNATKKAQKRAESVESARATRAASRAASKASSRESSAALPSIAWSRAESAIPTTKNARNGRKRLSSVLEEEKEVEEEAAEQHSEPTPSNVLETTELETTARAPSSPARKIANSKGKGRAIVPKKRLPAPPTQLAPEAAAECEGTRAPEATPANSPPPINPLVAAGDRGLEVVAAAASRESAQPAAPVASLGSASKPVQTPKTSAGGSATRAGFEHLQTPEGAYTPLPEGSTIWATPKFLAANAALDAADSSSPRKRQRTSRSSSPSRAIRDQQAQTSPTPVQTSPFLTIRCTIGGAVEEVHVLAETMQRHSLFARRLKTQDPTNSTTIELSHYDRRSIQRYLACFDPNPRLELPVYDWEEVPVGTPGCMRAPNASSKRFNNGDDTTAPNSVIFSQETAYKLLPIQWDLDALWELYFLGLDFGTPAVCDMVTDKFIEYAAAMDEHKEKLRGLKPQYTLRGLAGKMARLVTPDPVDVPDFYNLFDTDFRYLNLLWQGYADAAGEGARRFWTQLFLSHPDEAREYMGKYGKDDLSRYFLAAFAGFAFESPDRIPGWRNLEKLSEEKYSAQHCHWYHSHDAYTFRGDDVAEMCYERQWDMWSAARLPKNKAAKTQNRGMISKAEQRRQHKSEVRRKVRDASV